MTGVALPALLLACSVSNRPAVIDTPTLTAVVETFSAGNPNTVRNVAFDTLTAQDSRLNLVRPTTQQAARTAVAQILEAEGIAVVGLLPTRLQWASRYGHAPLELLQPCTNIRIATAKLASIAYACRKSLGKKAKTSLVRRCTLDLYAESLLLPALTQVVLSRLKARKGGGST